MPHRRTSIPLGLLLVLTVVAGCGGPPPSPGDPPPPTSTAEPCRPIRTDPGEIVYEGSGVRTYPAPSGTAAALTAQDALAGPDVRSWGVSSAQEVELRLVSTGDFGCVSHPTGVVRQAAWVVTLRATTPVLHGPPGRPVPDPAVTCYSVVIVDARTGAPLTNLQACGEDPPRRS